MKPQLRFGTEVHGAEAFYSTYTRAAAALWSAGLRPGGVVALMLRNEPIVLELMLAARWLGARWCLINWHFKEQEVRHILLDSGAALLVVHADFLGEVSGAIEPGVRVFVATPLAYTREAFNIAAHWPEPQRQVEDWVAFRDACVEPLPEQRGTGTAMVYTSGTTGLPKGIRREAPTAGQLALIAERSRQALGLEPGVRALVSAPLYHSAPSAYIGQAALGNAFLVIEPKFEALRTLELIESEKITHLYLVPTMYVRLLRLDRAERQRFDLSTVRFVASTGSPCAPEIKRRMIEWWGPVFHETYAASELGWISHIDSSEALRKPGSAGRAMPGIELKVLTEEGEEVPAGTVGLLYARDPAIPDFTYANNPAARQAIDRGGLWTLKDMGYVDEAGYLYVVDRKSDMVISGGVNIYPAEIEAVVLVMPGVADCAVFGVPDEEFGESLVAFVELFDGAVLEADQVREFVRARLADYKVPRVIRFERNLPREETGKIFKRKLREPFWANRKTRV